MTRRRDWLPLLGWLVLTYVVFAIAATKMSGYVLIALPVVFCAHGWFVARGLAGSRLTAAAAVLVCVTFLVHALLSAHQPWLAGWRTEPWAQEVEFFAREADALGAGPWRVIRDVVLPALMPAFIASGAIAFATAMGAFGTAFTLATDIDVLPMLIYTEFTLSANFAMSAALSVGLGLVTWAILALARTFGGNTVAAAG